MVTVCAPSLKDWCVIRAWATPHPNAPTAPDGHRREAWWPNLRDSLKPEDPIFFTRTYHAHPGA